MAASLNVLMFGSRLRPCLRFLKTISSSVPIRNYSDAQAEEIVIPHRIERSPTDILKALNSTISRDPTAPHYKFHDDPYLIPNSNLAKRTYALSKESGRKTARLIRDKNALLFTHREADVRGEVFEYKIAEPPIPAFYPRAVYDENSEVTEDILKDLIKQVQVSDAINVYQLLKTKSKSVSRATQQSLLELLCFYNSMDTLDEDFIEEQWHQAGIEARERHKRSWNEEGFAQQLFSEMQPTDHATYCTMIRGLARHFYVDRAFDLFQEMQSKDMFADVNTYNSILNVVHFLREGPAQRWQFIQELLSSMNREGVRPNIGTLNAVLSVLVYFPIKDGRSYALQTLAEFKELGIEPCLGTFYYLLNIFCKDRGPKSLILEDMLDYLESRKLQVQDLKDTFFFVTAMDVCSRQLYNRELAERLHAFLLKDDNYNFIGDAYKESIYYRHYFMLLCATEPFEKLMEHYKVLVPNIYTPEPAVMEEILKLLQMQDSEEAFAYLPILWSDLIIFGQLSRDSIVDLLLHIISERPGESGSPIRAQLLEQAKHLSQLAADVDEEQRNKMIWTGAMMENLLKFCLAGDEPEGFSVASVVMKTLIKRHQSIIGTPAVDTLTTFMRKCCELQRARQAVSVVKYAAEMGLPEAVDMANEIAETLSLGESEVAGLSSLLGVEIGKKTQTE